jgi:Ran GTPase-activating protein (RanGAP) involved in mRNA processing and transport
MRFLNLSKNDISDDIRDSLYTYLCDTKSLEVIYLHWNQIKAACGIRIAKALTRNLSIKVIDLSNNRMGGHDHNDLITVWCRTILTPKLELRHLDLSFNSLSIPEMKQLG